MEKNNIESTATVGWQADVCGLIYVKVGINIGKSTGTQVMAAAGNAKGMPILQEIQNRKGHFCFLMQRSVCLFCRNVLISALNTSNRFSEEVTSMLMWKVITVPLLH